MTEERSASWPRWAEEVGVEPGEADRVGIHIGAMTLADGHEVTLPESGVTAIVGANNSGKSTVLRQLHYQLTSPANIQSESIQLVKAVHLVRSGSGADFLAWLSLHAEYRERPAFQGGNQFWHRGSALTPSQAHSAWEQASDNIQQLGVFLVRYADAQNRFGEIGGVSQRNDVSGPPEHPLHQLQDDAELRRRLDELSMGIFRQPLTLDDLSGAMRLRVGRPTVQAPARDESQAPFRAALAQLPPLEQQGDGMKSLLGLLLPLVTATYPIIIVDEPEAFLHPPQAYALGQALGELARDSGVQVVLATHDRNLLAGLLGSEAPLSVVRLNRKEDNTSAAQLQPDQLRELWSDPVLRYSSVLDGLFHQLVVICEAERDCRFYAAALDAANRHAPTSMPPSDVLFVPANGKDGMARLAEALNAVAVPVLASPDLDVLNDKTVLRRLVGALGGDWEQLEADYEIATQPFRQPREQTLVRDVRDSLMRALDDRLADDPDARYGPETKEQVTALLRTHQSPWQALKDYGDRAFSGQSAEAAERLLPALDGCGLVTVRVGELEGFARATGVRKGKAWLPAALNAEAHGQEDAQAHVDRLMAMASNR